MTVTLPPSPLNDADVSRLYNQWDGINHFVETNRQVLRNSFTSSASGNHHRYTAKLPMDIAANESHHALRNVMYSLGNLFDPTALNGPADESYAGIQDTVKQHVSHVRKLKVIYEGYFGQNSAKPPKPGSCPINKSDRFKSVQELENVILGKSQHELKETVDNIQTDIICNNKQAHEQLGQFSQSLLQLPEMILKNTKGEQLTIPNRSIVTPISNKVVSIGYIFYLLKRQSQHDLDDTARPLAIQEESLGLFGQDSDVYKNIKNILFTCDLDNQPLIVREFETERDLLTQRIAYQIDHYDTFMNNCPLHPHDRMFRLLKLDQRDTFEEAKEAYRARLNAEKPSAQPRKKPIIISHGKCPFGYT